MPLYPAAEIRKRLTVFVGREKGLLAVSRGQISVPALATTFASGQVSWTPGTGDHLVAGADDEQVFLDLARHACGA